MTPDGDSPKRRERAASSDPKAEVALVFAAKLVKHRGHVSEADVSAVKNAGYNDAQLPEIILHVALDTLTNYLNTALATVVDFPVVTPLHPGDLR